jgi:hypothetical protein
MIHVWPLRDDERGWVRSTIHDELEYEFRQE